MADLVNLADVLEEAESDFFQAAIPNCGLGNALSRAVLAYGGGYPVVTETDGALYRGEPVRLWQCVDNPDAYATTGICCEECWRPVQAVILTAPVAPDA